MPEPPAGRLLTGQPMVQSTVEAMPPDAAETVLPLLLNGEEALADNAGPD